MTDQTLTYYMGENDNFQFIKFPTFLFTEHFEKLSTSAKLLFAAMLDRTKLSRRNGKEQDGKPYICYTIDSVQSLISCARASAVKYLKELRLFGLIEVRKSENGRNNIYFIRDFSRFLDGCSARPVEQPQSADVPAVPQNGGDFVCPDQSKNCTAASSEVEPAPVQNLASSQTEFSQTLSSDFSYPATQPFTAKEQRQQKKELHERRDAFEQELARQWDYETLCQSKELKPKVDRLLRSVANAVIINQSSFAVGNQRISPELFASRMLSLDMGMIEYYFEYMMRCGTAGRASFGYRMAVLYNAPDNADAYWDQWVQEDLRHYAEQ